MRCSIFLHLVATLALSVEVHCGSQLPHLIPCPFLPLRRGGFFIPYPSMPAWWKW